MSEILEYVYPKLCNLILDMGPKAWYDVCGDGDSPLSNVSQLYKEADKKSTRAGIGGTVANGTRVRVDKMQEVEEQMWAHLAEPFKGWLVVENLECRSNECGFCRKCAHGRADLPSQVFARNKTLETEKAEMQNTLDVAMSKLTQSQKQMLLQSQKEINVKQDLKRATHKYAIYIEQIKEKDAKIRALEQHIEDEADVSISTNKMLREMESTMSKLVEKYEKEKADRRKEMELEKLKPMREAQLEAQLAEMEVRVKGLLKHVLSNLPIPGVDPPGAKHHISIQVESKNKDSGVQTKWTEGLGEPVNIRGRSDYVEKGAAVAEASDIVTTGPTDLWKNNDEYTSGSVTRNSKFKNSKIFTRHIVRSMEDPIAASFGKRAVQDLALTEAAVLGPASIEPSMASVVEGGG